MKWFMRGWWKYLLDGNPSWQRVWCRIKGHPSGPVYYNVCGTEPDWKCKDCGEYLG